MLPLLYARFWLVVGWLLVIATISGSLAPAGALPGFGISDKVQHGFAYLLMLVWFAGIYRRERYPIIVLGLFLLGVGIEWLQGMMMQGREKALDDVVANAVGLGIGWILALTWLGGWAQRVEQRLPRR